MRAVLAVILLLALALSGCARKKSAELPPDGSSPAGAGVAPAGIGSGGAVLRVNPVARFVVLSFPLNHMPVVEQHLGLYRQGSRVGEVKVTGPQRGNSIVADIVTGAPEVGDEARAD